MHISAATCPPSSRPAPSAVSSAGGLSPSPCRAVDLRPRYSKRSCWPASNRPEYPPSATKHSPAAVRHSWRRAMPVVNATPLPPMRGRSHIQLPKCWDHTSRPDRFIDGMTWPFAGAMGPISAMPADVDGNADALPRHTVRGRGPSPRGCTRARKSFLTSVKLWRKAPSRPRSPPEPSKDSLKLGCIAGGRSRTPAHPSAHCGGALHSRRSRGAEVASATNFDTVHIRSASTRSWASANTSR
jgi:hypothetical protein